MKKRKTKIFLSIFALTTLFYAGCNSSVEESGKNYPSVVWE